MTIVAGALAISLAACGSAVAAGAIAFGSTGDVAKDGYSIGFAAGSASDEEARDSAIKSCRSNGAKQSQDQCEVLIVFHKQCAAEAQDPKAGTPGFGFAVAENEDSAKSLAMAICAATAGKNRRKSCTIITSRCDE